MPDDKNRNRPLEEDWKPVASDSGAHQVTPTLQQRAEMALGDLAVYPKSLQLGAEGATISPHGSPFTPDEAGSVALGAILDVVLAAVARDAGAVVVGPADADDYGADHLTPRNAPPIVGVGDVLTPLIVRGDRVALLRVMKEHPEAPRGLHQWHTTTSGSAFTTCLIVAAGGDHPGCTGCVARWSEALHSDEWVVRLHDDRGAVRECTLDDAIDALDEGADGIAWLEPTPAALAWLHEAGWLDERELGAATMREIPDDVDEPISYLSERANRSGSQPDAPQQITGYAALGELLVKRWRTAMSLREPGASLLRDNIGRDLAERPRFESLAIVAHAIGHLWSQEWAASSPSARDQLRALPPTHGFVPSSALGPLVDWLERCASGPRKA